MTHAMNILHHLLFPRIPLQCIGELYDPVAVGPHGKGTSRLHDGLLHDSMLLPPGVKLIVRVDDSHHIAGQHTKGIVDIEVFRQRGMFVCN